MPIASTDLLFVLSGGTGNTSAAASLGGTKSYTTISDNTLNNLFDDVSAAEATSGDVEYRGIFVMNSNSSLSLYSAKLWISASTTAPGDEWYIAVDTTAQPNTANSMSIIADESTAPGISGSWISTGATISFGDLASTKSVGIWIKRSVSVGAASYANNSASLAFSGETA